MNVFFRWLGPKFFGIPILVMAALAFAGNPVAENIINLDSIRFWLGLAVFVAVMVRSFADFPSEKIGFLGGHVTVAQMFVVASLLAVIFVTMKEIEGNIQLFAFTALVLSVFDIVYFSHKFRKIAKTLQKNNASLVADKRDLQAQNDELEDAATERNREDRE